MLTGESRLMCACRYKSGLVCKTKEQFTAGKSVISLVDLLIVRSGCIASLRPLGRRTWLFPYPDQSTKDFHLPSLIPLFFCTGGAISWLRDHYSSGSPLAPL